MFFARVFDYFHDAYVALLAETAHPLPTVLAEKRWIAPLVHAEASYRRPLRFGDRVVAEITAIDCEGSKATLHHQLVVDGQIAASGRTIHLFMDKDHQRTPIPEDLVHRFQTRETPSEG